MQEVRITGPRACEIVERPDPVPTGNYALVKVRVVPLCTECRSYRDGGMPSSLGHEAAGEVVAIGPEARIALGQRVVAMPTSPCGLCALCREGDYIHCEAMRDPLADCGCSTGVSSYAQYLLKPDWLLLPVPDEMSLVHASMACCGLGPAFGAARNSQLRAGDSWLVVGLGPVGLGAVIVGSYIGARAIGVDPNPWRRELAERLGATHTLAGGEETAAEVRRITGRGADRAVDCTGLTVGRQTAIDGTRRRGHVCFVGSGEWGMPLPNLMQTGITLQGSWHWNLHDAPLMMRMIQAVGPQLDTLITHHVAMADTGRAWDAQLSGQTGKVMMYPWPEEDMP